MKTRDFQIDTMKGILIFLVVLGHSFSYALFKSTEFVFNLYVGIYLFHMPLFVFIGGYFSKRHNEKRVIELFLIYVFWQMVINPLFMFLLVGESVESAINPLFSPHKSYWYLLSFIIWRVLTPYASKIKYILPLSIIAGLSIGFSEQGSLTAFSYSRTVAFYPFFIAGYLTTSHHLADLKAKISKYLGLICFIILLLIGIFYVQSLNSTVLKLTDIDEFLFYRSRYADTLVIPLLGPFIRASIYLISFGLVLLPFTFTPSTHNFLVKWGQNSLFIYLSHILVLSLLKTMFYEKLNAFDPFILIGISTLFSVLYCFIASLKPVMFIGTKLTTLKLDWLLKNHTSS